MNYACRTLLCLLLVVPASAFASSGFQQPTPEELSMTSDPANPNADALYLYREETTDDKLHVHDVYVRLKIFNDQGKKYADVEIPYEGRLFSIGEVRGRTIHSDGSIVPFTGKPFERTLMKKGRDSYKAKLFTMPDVQAGSIIEYRYSLRYQDDWLVPPRWYIQQELPVRKAHYLFQPTDHLQYLDTKGGSARIAFSQLLPKDAQVKPVRDTYVLDVQNIPPQPDEEFQPPMRSLNYRVLFYYTGYTTPEEFWKGEGKSWSKEMDRFAVTNGKAGDAARALAAGGGTPEQNLRKIYSAVMKLDNTSFTREHTTEENKAEGIKRIKNADDIWELKRGSSAELALLFIAMARAAGFKVYAMQVTNRDENIFQKYFLSTDQLDDILAVVQVGDKEVYLDPGQRYCTYGVLNWKHTMTGGLRQTDHGTELAETPVPSYKLTQIQRTADLVVGPGGQVNGSVRVFLSGSEALRWRQRAVVTDEAEILKEFNDELQATVPSGVELRTKHVVGLEDPENPLMVQADVSGSMGTATSKRMFLPTWFFEASMKPLFAHAQRESPVDLVDPYIAQDTIVIQLPAGETVESSPANVTLPLPQCAAYATDVKVEGGKLTLVRTLALANTMYMPAEFPALKTFFDKVNASDQQQTIVQAGPATVAQGAGK